jgi:hypothetical protein
MIAAHGRAETDVPALGFKGVASAIANADRLERRGGRAVVVLAQSTLATTAVARAAIPCLPRKAGASFWIPRCPSRHEPRSGS